VSSSSRRRPPSHPLLHHTARVRWPAVACCLLALAGCSAGPAQVAVPRPSAAAARVCRALHRALPATVAGQRRRAARPASDFTAVWGSPAIVLRCGVRKPDVLTPGTADYNPGTVAGDADGVSWLPQSLSGGAVRFTTTPRAAYVEVTLPAKYTGGIPDISDLVDLAHAIRETDPARLN
jgi:hypothetical protein